MATEIERKFLVNCNSFKNISTKKIEIRQGYICRRHEGTVRVRTYNDKAFLTVKGVTHGSVRDEWEYEIPMPDALAMLERCTDGSIIIKTRHIVPFKGFIWEVDEFHGVHEGLIIAEIEVPAPDTPFPLPHFIGDEVTGNPYYYNSNL